MQKNLLNFILIVLSTFPANLGFAQAGDESVYYKNFVRHANGDFCTHTAPKVSFTAYLNQDQSKILIENAPRWDIGGDPNIAGNGTFGVELGNLTDPQLQIGDSVFVRFTCFATGQQGVLADSVTSIPWLHFPQTLYLSSRAFPARPQNVTIAFEADSQRLITWTPEAGVNCSVYRRSVTDTISSGQSRMLYTRIAQNLTGGRYTDTLSSLTGHGYIVIPKSGDIFGPHSAEVRDFPSASLEVAATLVHLNPPQVAVTWQPPPESVNLLYRIYRSTSPDIPIGDNNLIGEVGDTSFLDSQVEVGATYFYRVVAVNAPGIPGEPSEETHVTVTRPNVPPGFQIEIYMTEDINHPSAITWGPDGRMFVSEVVNGEIKIIEDSDHDGYGDNVSPFASGFNTPVGLAWKGDSLYISSRGKITIVRDTDGNDVADVYNTIISNWPTSWHQNNQIIFDKDGYFFVALGSWADRTTGPSIYNNKILRISPDGTDIQIWADGIRNVYDMTFSAQGYLFGGDNGWQEGEHYEHPEELNYYARGRHYGYPDYIGEPPPNSGTYRPLVEFPAHTAPTGVMFYTGDQFPVEFQNDLYIAFYGPDIYEASYQNRAYRIVQCEVMDTTVTDTIEFANNFYGPVDIIQDSAGAMYVADIGGVFFRPPDVDGHIYKITYIGITSTGEEPIPLTFELQQNYPNPFNSQTVIQYTIPSDGFVELKIFNTLGQPIRTLVNAWQSPGGREAAWDGRNEVGKAMPSGLYFCRLKFMGRQSDVLKMMLLR